MDHQDRPKRCLPLYLGPSEHKEILLLRYWREDLSLQSSTIQSFDCTKRIHQNLGTVSTVTQNQKQQSPRISRKLDNQSRLSRILYPTYTGDYSNTDFLGMDHKLKKVHSRIITYSRLHFNLEQAIVSPPNSFIETLTSVLSRLLPLTVMSACKVTSINSRITHYAPFIHHGRLQLCFLQFLIKNRWSQYSQHWDSKIQLNTEYLSHLRWFNRPAVLRGVPLHASEPSLFFTVASLTGWGANWQKHQISGQWSPQEQFQHINWLELEAVRLTVLQWGPQWRSQTVRVYWDNCTALVYIRKQGGTHSISLFHKTLELFHLLDQFVIHLIPTHLPGACNVTADATVQVPWNGVFQ